MKLKELKAHKETLVRQLDAERAKPETKESRRDVLHLMLAVCDTSNLINELERPVDDDDDWSDESDNEEEE